MSTLCDSKRRAMTDYLCDGKTHTLSRFLHLTFRHVSQSPSFTTRHAVANNLQLTLYHSDIAQISSGPLTIPSWCGILDIRKVTQAARPSGAPLNLVC
jgi:hypothetical protein